MTYCPLTPDWQNGNDDCLDAKPATTEPANFTFIDVLPSDTLADIARRAYGSNNVVNRLKIELANNGNITGTIRIPK
jgi:hypothetical protein